MRRTISALAVISLLAAACSGDGGALFDGDGTSSTAASAPSTAGEATTAEAVSGEVGPDGLLLDLGSLGSLDVPAGALPEGTELSVEPIDPSTIPLPPGTELVGQPIQVSTSAQPIEPVIIVLPIPEGAPTEDLWLLHVSDDGASEIVGGAVERGEFVAAVRSLSSLAAVHGKVSEWLDYAGVPAVDISVAGETPAEGPLVVEKTEMFTGERDEPATRVVRIVGPGEIGVYDALLTADKYVEDGVYYVAGFESLKPRFVEYTWTLYGGDGGRVSTSWSPDVAVVSASRPGRYTLTVDVFDPVTGATAFGTKRILVADGLLVAVLASTDDYCSNPEPNIAVSYTGGVHPVVVDVAVGTQTTQRTFDDVPDIPFSWTFSPIGKETLAEAIVTDAEGNTVSSEALLSCRPGGPDALISGPASVAVGEEAEFTAEIHDIRPDELVWVVAPDGAVAEDGETLRVTWDEPGTGRVALLGDPGNTGMPILEPLHWFLVEITGDPEPLALRVPDPPTSLTPGQEGVWTVRVKGGIVAPATGFRGYTVTADFGDESAPVEVEIPVTTAASFTERFPIPYSYEDPGEYTVTITATSPDGASATKAFPMTVADQIVLSGEFFYDNYLNTPVWRVSKNRIELVIRGTEVEVTHLESDTDHTYVGFTIGGSDVEPDCTHNQVITLTGYDLTFDPETQTITGTVQGRRVRTDDVGSNCPFGGRDGEETDIDSEVIQWVTVNGEIEALPGIQIVDGTIDYGWLLGFFDASVVGG